MSKKRSNLPRQGPNPARVAATQERRRSGAAGTHKQVTDTPRSEQVRGAIEESLADLYEDLED